MRSRSGTDTSSGGPEHSPELRGSLETLLLVGVDAGLIAALFLVPLAMGGRSAIGPFALAVFAIWTAACWCLVNCVASRPEWRWSWAQPVILGALGLVVFQIVPLPCSVVKTLSPQLYERLPLWSPDTEPGARLGVWNTLSLAPAIARSSLIVLVSYGLLCLVALQRVRRIEDVERILKWIAVAGSAMAAFGVLQLVLGNGKYFWCYEYPFTNSIRNATGSFINRNHFAHFVVLAIGPLVWWIQSRLVGFRQTAGDPMAVSSGGLTRGTSRRRLWDAGVGLPIALLGLCVFAVLLSLSRGGTMAMLVAVVVCVLILYRGSLVDGRTVLFLSGTAVLVATCLGIYGYKTVSSRLESFESVDRLDAGFLRRSIWRADLTGIADFPLAGTGAGNHTQAYAMYLPDDERTQYYEFVHAESGYLEIGLEAGIPALGLLTALMAVCAVSCLRAMRDDPPRRILLCLAAIVPSLVASALHSLVDFMWYVPGCTIATLLLAACACRMGPIRSSRGGAAAGLSVPRAVWAGALVGVGFLGYPMVHGAWAAMRAEPSWHRFLVQARELARARQPAAMHPQAKCDALVGMARELSEVVRWQPDHPQAHAKLAEVAMRLFEHTQDDAGPISVRQLGHTVLASRFASKEQLQGWLARAFPARHQHLQAALEHARRAVALCPLQGQAYLCLSALGFLDGPLGIVAEAYVNQALKVRPFDGDVLCEAGQQSLLAGDVERAVEFWKQSFQCGSYHQDRLFDLLCGQAPAEFFVQTFSMDLAAIKRLEQRYRAQNQTDQARALLRPRAEAAVRQAAQAPPAGALRAWLDAADARKQLADGFKESGDTAGWSREMAACLDSLREALGCDCSNCDVLLSLAVALAETGERREALEKVKEVLRWRPNDARARRLQDEWLTAELRIGGRPQPAVK